MIKLARFGTTGLLDTGAFGPFKGPTSRGSLPLSNESHPNLASGEDLNELKKGGFTLAASQSIMPTSLKLGDEFTLVDNEVIVAKVKVMKPKKFTIVKQVILPTIYSTGEVFEPQLQKSRRVIMVRSQKTWKCR